MNYKIKKWKPLENLSSKYFLNHTDDDLGELILYLEEDEEEKVGERKTIKKIEVSFFFESLCSYKVINTKNHNFKIKELINNTEKLDTESWTFFKVYDSDYNRSLSDGSFEVIKPNEFHHFLFICSNAVIEVLDLLDNNLEFAIKSS